jgi:hypothetical protein
MVTYIFLGCLILCAIIGIVEVFSVLEQKILCDEKNLKSVILLPVKSNELSPEISIISAISKAKWGLDKESYKVILIDLGLDEQDKEICKTLIEQYRNIKFCKKDDVDSLMNIINA